MTLPLVIGIGVTNGIHILNRFAEEQNPAILARSTGKAVLLCALTTIAGFGSLIIAQHRGFSSLGMLMSVGTAACMCAGLTFLPTLIGSLVRLSWTMAPSRTQSPESDSPSGPARTKGTPSGGALGTPREPSQPISRNVGPAAAPLTWRPAPWPVRDNPVRDHGMDCRGKPAPGPQSRAWQVVPGHDLRK